MPTEKSISSKTVFRIVPKPSPSDSRIAASGSDSKSPLGKKRRKKKSLLLYWKRWLLGVPFLLLLPFILLVRLSSMFYSDYRLNAWVAVALGAVIGLFLFTAAVYAIARVFGLKPGRRSIKTLTVVFASYTVYLLVFVSANNVKAPEIRETYTALHPAIRVALSSFMLLDGNAVVTDAQRQAADYEKMGLSTPNSSLHYTQENGFVHAIDLRTNDRSEFRNLLTAAYFRIMGFSTLRHTGTADHLHVSLRIPES